MTREKSLSVQCSSTDVVGRGVILDYDNPLSIKTQDPQALVAPTHVTISNAEPAHDGTYTIEVIRIAAQAGVFLVEITGTVDIGDALDYYNNSGKYGAHSNGVATTLYAYERGANGYIGAFVG